MTRMNWDRVNRENRAISEANRVLEPEPVAARSRKKRRSTNTKRRRTTEKARALAWHRQNRAATHEPPVT